MSKLLLPNNKIGLSKAEQTAQEARNTLVLGFQFLLPGETQPLQISLHQPTPLEGVAAAVVAAAMQVLMARKADAVADKLLGNLSVN